MSYQQEIVGGYFLLAHPVYTDRKSQLCYTLIPYSGHG